MPVIVTYSWCNGNFPDRYGRRSQLRFSFGSHSSYLVRLLIRTVDRISMSETMYWDRLLLHYEMFTYFTQGIMDERKENVDW